LFNYQRHLISRKTLKEFRALAQLIQQALTAGMVKKVLALKTLETKLIIYSEDWVRFYRLPKAADLLISRLT